MRLVRIVLATGALAALACTHRVSADSNFWGCKDLPPIGPKSHLTMVRAAAPDSQLLARRSGRLLVIVSWSSDSLAGHSKPAGALVLIAGPDGKAFVTDSAGRVAPVELPVPPDSYYLVMRFIGTQTLDTIVTVRQGYPDTANAFLQAGGMTICA